jgi:hypothetical protein
MAEALASTRMQGGEAASESVASFARKEVDQVGQSCQPEACGKAGAPRARQGMACLFASAGCECSKD